MDREDRRSYDRDRDRGLARSDRLFLDNRNEHDRMERSDGWSWSTRDIPIDSVGVRRWNHRGDSEVLPQLRKLIGTPSLFLPFLEYFKS